MGSLEAQLGALWLCAARLGVALPRDVRQLLRAALLAASPLPLAASGRRRLADWRPHREAGTGRYRFAENEYDHPGHIRFWERFTEC